MLGSVHNKGNQSLRAEVAQGQGSCRHAGNRAVSGERDCVCSSLSSKSLSSHMEWKEQAMGLQFSHREIFQGSAMQGGKWT